jgi:hypothetical protein
MNCTLDSAWRWVGDTAEGQNTEDSSDGYFFYKFIESTSLALMILQVRP